MWIKVKHTSNEAIWMDKEVFREYPEEHIKQILIRKLADVIINNEELYDFFIKRNWQPFNRGLIYYLDVFVLPKNKVAELFLYLNKMMSDEKLKTHAEKLMDIITDRNEETSALNIEIEKLIQHYKMF